MHYLDNKICTDIKSSKIRIGGGLIGAFNIGVTSKDIFYRAKMFGAGLVKPHFLTILSNNQLCQIKPPSWAVNFIFLFFELLDGFGTFPGPPLSRD